MLQMFKTDKYYHENYRDYHIPIIEDDLTLKEAMEIMNYTGSDQYKVPLIIRLIENPNYSLPYLDFFNGAVDIYHHDCIHLLLGRGMMPKDEAFVIGYTMGSTNKVSMFQKMMFKFITKYIYKKPWNFDSADLKIFELALMLGHRSKIKELDKIDFKSMEDLSLKTIRNNIGMETGVIKIAYKLEASIFPNEKESIRN